MRVPQSAWFTQVLLYWDQVGVIVPNYREVDHDPYMRELREFEMLRYVSPQATVLSNEAVFQEKFLELHSRITRKPEHLRTYENIHVDKLSRGVLVELE